MRYILCVMADLNNLFNTFLHCLCGKMIGRRFRSRNLEFRSGPRGVPKRSALPLRRWARQDVLFTPMRSGGQNSGAAGVQKVIVRGKRASADASGVRRDADLSVLKSMQPTRPALPRLRRGKAGGLAYRASSTGPVYCPAPLIHRSVISATRFPYNSAVWMSPGTGAPGGGI